MGYSRVRTSRNGKPRYTAYYWDVRGKERSAGTYSSRKDADDAWQTAEAKVREGRASDPRRGRQRFRQYVEEQWFPNHRLELRARENYTYYLNRHIIGWFGPMRMIEILPSHVRAWVIKLEGERVPASSIAYCLTILSAIFTTALNDQVVFLHPCKGVKGPIVPKKVRQIVTPEQFELLYEALTDDAMRLLVETDIESGLRWGELTELRPKDFNVGSRMVTVSRVAVELVRGFHPDGGRFLVKEYPKDEEHRQVTLSTQLIKKIQAHIAEHSLNDDELLSSCQISLASRRFARCQLPILSAGPRRTPRDAPTGTAHSVATPRASAAATTVKRRMRSTAPNGGRAARTARGGSASLTPMGIFHADGSATMSGSPRGRQPGWGLA
jgi:integrase